MQTRACCSHVTRAPALCTHAQASTPFPPPPSPLHNSQSARTLYPRRLHRRSRAWQLHLLRKCAEQPSRLLRGRLQLRPGPSAPRHTARHTESGSCRLQKCRPYALRREHQPCATHPQQTRTSGLPTSSADLPTSLGVVWLPDALSASAPAAAVAAVAAAVAHVAAGSATAAVATATLTLPAASAVATSTLALAAAYAATAAVASVATQPAKPRVAAAATDPRDAAAASANVPVSADAARAAEPAATAACPLAAAAAAAAAPPTVDPFSLSLRQRGQGGPPQEVPALHHHDGLLRRAVRRLPLLLPRARALGRQGDAPRADRAEGRRRRDACDELDERGRNHPCLTSV